MADPRASRSQQERILDAMVTVAARYGYGGASVAKVIREAGVSRTTFYECFGDREDCFLAAYRRLAGPVEEEIERLGERPPQAVLGPILAAAERDPAAARVLLVESLAGPGVARREHERLLATLVGGIARPSPSSPARPPFLARALLGGIGGVVAIRAFRGEAADLASLRDDLLVWVDSYVPSTGAGPGELTRAATEAGSAGDSTLPPPLGAVLAEKPLPRGRGALPASAVAERQRKRIFAAVARLSRTKGYAAMSVADLVATSGVTREAFYEHFRGKQDAFLATQAFGLEESVLITAGKFFSEESWPERVWNGAGAMLAYIASQPDLAYVDPIESYAAGPAAIRRSFENRMAFTLFLEQGFRQRPPAEAMPQICAEAIAAAISELLRFEVQAGRVESLLGLLPRIAYLILAPFLGAAAATEFIDAKLRGAPGSA